MSLVNAGRKRSGTVEEGLNEVYCQRAIILSVGGGVLDNQHTRREMSTYHSLKFHLEIRTKVSDIDLRIS